MNPTEPGLAGQGLVGSVLDIFFLPYYVFRILWRFFFALFQLFTSIIGGIVANFKWVLLLLLIWSAAYLMLNNYQTVVSTLEYVNRCVLYEYWINYLREFLLMVRDLYNDAICWTNALGQLNRIINLNLLFNTLRKCDSGQPFDFYDFLRMSGRVVVRFISDTLRWSFSANLLYSAYPGYLPWQSIANDVFPYVTQGMICLCEDARILFVWASRLFYNNELSCVGHQLTNAALSGFQTVVRFILDILYLILFTFFGGGTAQDVSDSLLGISGADVTIPNLSNTAGHERLNAAGVYLGRFLDTVFLVSYCTVDSELNAGADVALAEANYAACVAIPENRPKLFCIVGIIVTGLDRAYRMQSGLLWHMPQILYETFVQPAGDRYLIDVWYEKKWQYFFDTIRDPLPIRNYSVSLHSPTVIAVPESSILWPDDILYGPAVKPNCNFLNNTRFGVPCEQCPLVSEVDGETCACETADYLDGLTEPLTNITFWKPWICCGVPRYVRAGVAAADYFAGFLVHMLNIDRMPEFISDYNKYDIFFDEIAGRPEVVGGFLLCLQQAVLGFDSRLLCFANLIVKPFKALVETYRAIAFAAVALMNTIFDTALPGFPDFICLTTPNCVRLENVFSHLRRPRGPAGYDPIFTRQEAETTATQPAFIDCVCFWIDFDMLEVFLDDPPSKIPRFCCFLDYFFRGYVVEQYKFFIELALASFETIVTVFDDDRPFTFVIIEWAACVSVEKCSSLNDLISDGEDFLNCPCLVAVDLDEVLDTPAIGQTNFFCLCNIAPAAVQNYISNVRATMTFSAATWQLIYCLGNGWPTPQCSTELHLRFKAGFEYLETAANAFSGTVGGIGCILGLPWVGLEIDCLGTTFTWPTDYPTCSTSLNTAYGPGNVPCTMSDRLSQLFFYFTKLLLTLYRFAVNRVELLIDIGFSLLIGPGPETSISGAIVSFFLEVRDPLFGTTNKLLSDDFNTITTYPWPNYTGINLTEVETKEINDTATILTGWTYKPPPSGIIYGKSFNYSIIAGLNETTGLFQAVGLTINCLLGPPTSGNLSTCPGPLLFASSVLDGTTGCFGDLLIAIANALRDVYTKIINFLGNGLKVLEYLFTNPQLLGSAIRDFITSFFEIIFVIVQNAQIIVDAIISVIIEATRFVFGDGIAEMFRFFLTVISKIIELFILVIQFLLAPFIEGQKRMFVNLEEGAAVLENARSGKKMEAFKTLYSMGFDSYDENFFQKWVDKKRDVFFNADDDDDDGGRNRKEDKKRQNYSWRRLKMADFKKAHAEEMTDGTMCKRVMVELSGLERFSGMTLEQEIMWKTCFFLYSLPNEIRGYTGGSVSFDADTFYNPLTFLNVIKYLLATWTTYSENRVEQTMLLSSEGGTYTEIMDVPEAILKVAEAQNALQRDSTKKRTASNPNSQSRKRTDPKDGWDSDEEEECYFDLDSNVGSCVDFNGLFPGYSVVFEYPPVPSETEVRNYLLTHKKMQNLIYVEKRGLIDSQSGQSVASNRLYNGLNYDDPESPKYNPFLGTQTTIYTSIANQIYLNISKLGYLLPVLDGKIAITHEKMTYYDYMRKANLDSTPNLALVESYEAFNLQNVKESYLRVNAKAINLGMQFRSEVGNVDDPDNLLPWKMGSKKFPKSDEKKKTKRNHLDAMKSANTGNHEKEFDPKLHKSWGALLRDATQSKSEKDADSGSDRSVNRNEEPKFDLRKMIYRFWDGVKDRHASMVGYVEFADATENLQGKKRNLMETVSDPTFFKEFASKNMKKYVKRRNKAHELAMDKSGRKQMTVRKAAFELFPDLLAHLTKSLGGFFDHALPNMCNGTRSDCFGNVEGSLTPTEELTDFSESSGYRKLGTVSEYCKNASSIECFAYGEDKIGFLDVASGKRYDSADETFVVHMAGGRVRTFKTFDLEILKTDWAATENEDFVNLHDHRYVKEDLGYFHHESLISHHLGADGNDGPTQTNLPMLHFNVRTNYYEHHYTPAKNHKTCFLGIMWDLYVKIDMTVYPHAKEWVAKNVYEANVKSFRNMSEFSPSEIVVKLHKCFRKSDVGSKDIMQIKFGRVLKGRSLLDYKKYQLEKYYGIFRKKFDGLTDWNFFKKQVKKHYVKPKMELYKKSLEAGNRSGLTGLMVLYEDVRQKIVGLNSEKGKIPNSFLEELGHKKRKYAHSRNSSKRAVFPDILNVCLPADPTDPGSTTTNCDSCRSCDANQCSFCQYCYDCNQNSDGSFSCAECGACRSSTEAYCGGGCTGCTGCAEQPRCLNCRLVQEVLAKAYEIVNFCVEWKINNNTDVILKPLPGTTLYALIPLEATATAPVFDEYGLADLGKFIVDSVLYLIGSATGVDIVATIEYFLTTLNIDPFNDDPVLINNSVGLLYILRYKLPLPFISRCNRDLHLMCTFGMGLERALAVTGIIALVLLVAVFLNFSLFGVALSVAGIIPLFLITVATLAWHYNAACLSEPIWGIFKAAGFNFLVFGMYPVCMMDEIFAFLDKYITQNTSLVVDDVVVGGNATPANCSVFVEIIDCAAEGFGSPYGVLGYAGQRFLPEPLRYYLVEYLNRTCLALGSDMLGTNGPLLPFFETNFTDFIERNPTGADYCFYYTSFSLGLLLVDLILYGTAFFLLISIFFLFLDSFLQLLRLAPFKWFLPFF